MKPVQLCFLAPAAALLALIGGFFVGRATAPTKVVETSETAESSKSREAEQSRVAESRRQSAVATSEAKSATQLKSDLKTNTNRWWKVIKRPDGSSERSGGSASASAAASEVTSEEEKRQAATWLLEKESLLEKLRLAEAEAAKTVKTTKIVEAQPARAMIGAHASKGLDGEIGWGPMGSYSFGPLEVLAAVNVPGRALMLGAGVRF